jgi:hypothetical protein
MSHDQTPRIPMNLSPNEAHQHEIRRAFHDGAPGILVSGLVWITAALVSWQLGTKQAVWTLLIGGALIYPLGLLLTKVLGHSATTDKRNPMNQLAMASTVWLILGCAMAYGLYLFRPVLFFPAMMATIGCRYMIFATIYGTAMYWLLGATLLVAANLSLFLMAPPTVAAGLGGLIEVVFAVLVFSKASKPVA